IEVRRRNGATLSAFTSDGCSGGLSAGWTLLASAIPAIAARHGEHPPWEPCCVTHDRSYHAGAPSDADAEASFRARRRADEELRQCVIKIGETRTPELAVAYGLSQSEFSLLYTKV